MMALRPFLVVLWPALLVGCDGKSDTGRSNLSTDADGDGFPDGTDCDDADPAVHPDAVEVCDGIDNDCDSLVDDEDDSLDMDTAQVFHADGDGDGFGDPAAAVSACSQPSGAVEDGTDCDDADPAVNPGAVEICDELDVDEDCSGVSDDADDGVDPSSASSWYADADGDGFGDAAAVSTSCDPGPDQVADATDCDDGDENIHPDATEVCDDLDVDEDCSGAADDADPGVDASSRGTWHTDADGDGFGDPATATSSCEAPSGAVADGTDCEDGDPAVHPAATEICDALDVDEDCSGAADDADPGVDAGTQTATRPDADGDGFGDASASDTLYCDLPAGTVVDATDCDDTDAAVHPEATEVCDALDVDEDCSGAADDADSGVDPTTQTATWPDVDGDGFGDETASDTPYCDPPSGMVADATDCDDASADVNPGASEVCDALDVDEDCSGAADDADPGVDASTYTDWYPDVDGDGFGDAAATPSASCDSATGLTDATDCDDADAAVNPGASEVCDAIDNDCDPATTQAGMVSFTDATGTLTDVTSAFSAGSATAPVAFSASSEGDYTFCDGTFYTHIDASADTSFRGIDGTVVLDGGDAGSVVQVSTSGVSIELEDLSIEAGLAASLSMLGYVGGGGVACVGGDEVVLTNVTVRDSEAEIGGGIAAEDCDLVLESVTVEDNFSYFGGGGVVALGAGSASLTDSVVAGNESSFGGGLLFSGPGPYDLTDSVVEANIGSQASGAAFLNSSSDAASISCVGSATATAGFVDNASSSSGGFPGPAVEIGESAVPLSFTASECDFGTLAAGNENENGGLAHVGSDWLLRYGDDMSFACSSSGCGTQTTHSLGSTGTQSQYSADDQLRGNVFLATASGTIDQTDMALNPDSSCILDYYVFSNSGLATTGWTKEHENTGNSVGAGGWFSWSDTEVGVPTIAGRYYAVLVGWSCSTGGDNVEFLVQGSADTPEDLSVGSHVGTVEMGGYAGSSGSAGVSLTVTATTEQHAGTILSTVF